MSAAVLAGIITMFTPVTFALAPAHILPNAVTRFSVLGAIVLWFSYSLRPRATRGSELFGLAGSLGIALITSVEAHVSGELNHPFLFGPAFILLAYGMFVPVRPAVFFGASWILALSQLIVARTGFTPASGTMTSLLFLMTVTLGLFGAISNGRRRSHLLRLFQSQAELRQREAHLRATLGRLQTTQDQLVTSERMALLGRLTGGIAHEMSTPLASARISLEELRILHEELAASIGHADVTEADLRDILHDAEEALSLGHSATKRAARYIHDLKSRTRGLGVAEAREFSLADEIDGIVKLLGFRMRQENLEVDTRCPREATLCGDAGQFCQVIANLLENAMDACGEASCEQPISVCVEQDERYVTLSVVDHASGIPAALQDRVFEPLVTTKPAGKGTGLGLALSRDIVVGSFGGQIAYEDTPGGGATFVVTLPRSGATGLPASGDAGPFVPMRERGQM